MFISCTLPLQTPLLKDHFTHYYVDQNKQIEYHTFPLIRFYIQQKKVLFGGLKWAASSKCSFYPNSARAKMKTTIIGKTHPTLVR